MQARRFAPVVFAVLLVLVGAADDLSADRSETPTWYYGWEIQPYMFDIGDAPEMRRVAEHQDYIISSHRNLVASFDPEPLVTDVEGEYGNHAGIGLISSHGSLRGQAIEVYPYTQAGSEPHGVVGMLRASVWRRGCTLPGSQPTGGPQQVNSSL